MHLFDQVHEIKRTQRGKKKSCLHQINLSAFKSSMFSVPMSLLQRNTFLGFHSVKWVMIFFFLTLLFRILRLRPVKMVAEEAQITTTLRILKKNNN